MNPSTVGYLWLVLASVASASATFLIKMSNQAGEGINLARLMWLGGACSTYVLGFVCYSLALAKLEISIAYPFMTAVTIVMVTILGSQLLHETLTPMKILGMLLIGAGAFVVAR